MNELKKIELRSFMSRQCRMVRDWLLDELYHDATKMEMMNVLGAGASETELITNSPTPMFNDILRLLHASNLNFGITIQDPVSGREVTLYADDNLADTAPLASEVDEVTDYTRLGDDKKGLEGIEIVNPVVVDGNYDHDGNIAPEVTLYDLRGKESRNHRRKGAEYLSALIDSDRPWDVSPDIPPALTVAANVTATYIMAGDQHDLDQDPQGVPCENCLNHNRIADSMICHICAMSGVIASAPEEGEEPGFDTECSYAVHGPGSRCSEISEDGRFCHFCAEDNSVITRLWLETLPENLTLTADGGAVIHHNRRLLEAGGLLEKEEES